MKTGEYTARIGACRAKLLAIEEVGVAKPAPEYSALFTAEDEAIEARCEQEILDLFGGYDAMVETFEGELAGAKSMTVPEAIIYLRSLATGDELD